MYENVIDKYRRTWPFEDKLPFEWYYEQIQNIIDKANFKPTEDQLDVLLSYDKISLVEATAGSGKTTVIVLKSIIDEELFQIHPHSIMFLTFSRKSAGDMTYRRNVMLAKNFGKDNKARMSTLHSFCFKFVSTFGSEPGNLKNFGIHRLISDEMATYLDEDYSYGMSSMESSLFGGFDEDYYFMDEDIPQGVTAIDIVKRMIKEDPSLEYIDEMSEIKNIMACFSYQKERMLSDEEILKERIFQSLLCSPEDYFKLRKRVEDYKKLYEYFDFTDLELYTLELLKNHKDYFYSNESFKAVFKPTRLYVDEMQDMTPLQKKVIQELINTPTNDGRETSLVCIGDGDQRIYSWRGADTLEFDKFCDLFDPTRQYAKLYTLRMNHRCGENIIEPARKLIKNNKLRNEKDIIARGGDPGKFEIIPYINTKDMISTVVKYIRSEYETYGKEALKDVAIIYREHYQVLGIVTALLRLDIPFNLSGIKLPYKHWIFNNLLRFCETILFDYRTQNVSEVYKFTPLNKKDAELLKKQVEEVSATKRGTYGWIEHLQNNYLNKKRPYLKYETIVELMTLQKALDSDNTSIQFILQKLYSMYMMHNLDYTLKKLIHVERSEIESIEYFINSIPKSENYLKLLDNIKNWDSYINNYRYSQSGVKLMTMHATKGLEFKKVVIIGMDNSFCPKLNYMKELDEKNRQEYLEEERRLFFVGITRAIEECTVMVSMTDPSILIFDIDESLKDILNYKEDITESKNDLTDTEEEVKNSVVIPIKVKNISDKIFKEELEWFFQKSQNV